MPDLTNRNTKNKLFAFSSQITYVAKSQSIWKFMKEIKLVVTEKKHLYRVMNQN